MRGAGDGGLGSWQAARRIYRTRHEPDPIDLGNEPPLSVDGEDSGLDRPPPRLVQWFSGTILTGLCGAALMGGAVFAALDGETNFAAVPERVEAALRGAFGAGDRTGRAQGRPAAAASPSPMSPARSFASRPRAAVGDREVVRVRPFVRVTANLSLSMTELSANIPPFNPAALLGRCRPRRRPPPRRRRAPRPTPRSPSSRATSPLSCRAPRSRSLCRSTTSSRACARRRIGPGQGRPTYAVASMDPGMQARLCGRRQSATPTPASRRASFPRTSRCCPRPRARPPAAIAGTSERSSPRRASPSARSCASSAPPPRRPRRSPARSARAARDGGLKEGQKLRVLLDAVRQAPAAAADPGHRRRRQRGGSGRRALRHRQIRLVDVQSINTTTDVADDATKRRTTAAACGSIRASTRPRCAIRCRGR